MKRLIIFSLISLTSAIIIFVYKQKNLTTIAFADGLVIKKEWLIENKNPLTNKKDIRAADQTFLTFPEWFLVFSPQEQADYFKQHTSTNFPYTSHIKQIWESYHIVNNQIKDNFPTNKGYHFMIWVIGSSASVEYTIKALYETTVGRLTNTYNVVTDEDKFNAAYTNRYVEFIKDKPWYEFNFTTELKNLWSNSSFFGDHFCRKLERKYFLTTELLVKIGYGKLIGLGTKQVYEEALPTTVVVLNDSAALSLNRYQKFINDATQLAKQGKDFKEIAGNNSAIILSVIVPNNASDSLLNAQIIFTQPISSNSINKRVVAAIPVNQLAQLLRNLDGDKINIEHIFDY